MSVVSAGYFPILQSEALLFFFSRGLEQRITTCICFVEDREQSVLKDQDVPLIGLCYCCDVQVIMTHDGT